MKRLIKNSKAFTLAELLIVVAIIAVLVTISIPIFTTQLEKSRNAVDLSNARSIGAALSVYYMTDSQAFQDLENACNVSGSNHCVELTVRSDKIACNDLLSPALISAGLIKGPISSNHTYSSLKCKSKQKWMAYSIAITTYQRNGRIQIAYRGRPQGDNLSGHSWTWYSTQVDPTGFHQAINGDY